MHISRELHAGTHLLNLTLESTSVLTVLNKTLPCSDLAARQTEKAMLITPTNLQTCDEAQCDHGNGLTWWSTESTHTSKAPIICSTGLIHSSVNDCGKNSSLLWSFSILYQGTAGYIIGVVTNTTQKKFTSFCSITRIRVSTVVVQQ